MVVIVVAVITQGFRVPAESRGEIKSILFANYGFFQAVGVISFGAFRYIYHFGSILMIGSICLSYVQSRPPCFDG